MKIGLSTSVMQRGRSGVGQYVLSLVRALMRDKGNHRITLFVLEDDLPLFRFAADAVTLVPVPERYRSPILNVLWHQFVLPRLARKHRLDVLHVPSYRRLLWSRPCALVATIHDLAPFTFPGKYDFLRMFYGRVVVPWLARRQDEIIAVSQYTARDIEKFFTRLPRRPGVVYNGLNHEQFRVGPQSEAKAEVSSRHGLQQPYFLYVARLEHPAKNHARLITAFNEFKSRTGSPWDLVFAGSDWHGADTIHRLIRQSTFASSIRSLGFVPDADLPALYRAADLFVFPSLYEGFGLPPVEAMACGCPVLSSTRGALGEVVGDAAAVLNPEHIGDILQQLCRLAADRPARDELRARGIARAAGFDWGKTASATLEVYTRAVARRMHVEPRQVPRPQPGSWVHSPSNSER